MMKYLHLILFLLIVFGVSAFGALFPPGDWYAGMDKPFFNPPSWVFAPVWTILYAMIAVAAWLVWTGRSPNRGQALGVWAIQLLLNAAWSWLFFGLHRPGWALAELTVLIAAVWVTYRAFKAISPPAGKLMLPYLAWLVFAWILNLSLWRLNGGGLESLLR